MLCPYGLASFLRMLARIPGPEVERNAMASKAEPSRIATATTACGLALATAVLCFAAPVRADGTFAQFDLSEDTADAVVSVGRGRLGFGATYSRYEGGSSATAAITYAFPLGEIGTLKIGPSLGRAFGDTDNRDMRVGARVSLERYKSTGFGHVFLLGEYDTIDSNWFAIGQVGLSSGYGIELSAGGSDNYEAQTIALTKRLGAGPVSLRAGYKLVTGEIFAGLSINTF